MSDKVKYELEFVIKSSASFLYKYLASPSGLSGWFADDVNSRGEIFTFIWENESYSLIALPDVLPKCSKDFSDWVYPFIEVKNSEWLEKYESISSAYNDSKLRQYALISMNDLVMVLTSEEHQIKVLNEIA